MTPGRARPSEAALATAIVAATGLLWGLYWIPVRALAAMGLAGAWGTVAITLAAALLTAPFVLARPDRLTGADRVALASTALGGAAFALYSVGFVYGRVAVIVLLYFLTPVWSTLIARLVLRRPVPRLRLVAIAVGLAGLAAMLGADGAPWPRGAGEWMALSAGFLWSVSTTGLSGRPDLSRPVAAFAFAAGALLAALALAAWLPAGGVGPPARDASPAAAARLAIAGLALASGALWWVASVAALVWAAARLDPARVGILLMTEVVCGAASAALLAGERLGAAELAGGALVLAAGLLEVWPSRRAQDRGPAGS